MKRLNTVSPISGKVGLPLKYLVVAMAAMVALPVAQADVAGKKIGDLEIYKAAEGGKTTITMMLDTSGSMSIYQVNYACDLPAGTSYIRGSEPSSTDPSYARNYCDTKKYFFRQDRDYTNVWYRCGNEEGSGSNDYSFNDCGTRINYVPAISGFEYVTSGSNNRYFYKSTRTYDRLTRLKDAIFTLMLN